MESLSISLIMPLISVITDNSGWSDTWYAKLLCSIAGVSDKRSYVIVLIIILIIIFIVKNIYLVFEYYYQYSFVAQNRYKMQHSLMHAYTSMEYKYFLHSSSGEIIRIVTQDTNQTFALLTQVLLFYTEIVVCAILGATIFFISPSIAASLIIILLMEVLIIAAVIKPVMKRDGDKQREQNANANKWLLQSINGIKSIKVSNAEEFFESNYSVYAKNSVNIDKKYQTLNAMPRFIIEAFTIVGVLVMMLSMVSSGVDLNQLLPPLSAFLLSAVRLLPSVNRISGVVNIISFYEGGLDNIIDALNNVPRQDGNMHKERLGYKFDKIISIEDVTFSYEGDKDKVLENAFMEIKKGESIGIIGASGSGKTTTVDILMGLLKPQSGRITIDGVDIFNDIKSWHSQLAYIPQNIFLMDSSIKDNILFGRHDEDEDERVQKALELAQMAEFVNKLPDGVDTLIGEQGVRLSGGQRQRIGIARALYADPELLFFDEATSALDNETEAAIMGSVDNLKGTKTIVIIAHRLTTIKNCDMVYEIKGGKILKVEKKLVKEK